MKKYLITIILGLLCASNVSAASNPFFWKLTGGNTLEPILSSWAVSIPLLSVGAITMTGDLDLDGNALIIDTDGDSSIQASTDDLVVFKTGGSDRMGLSNTGLSIGTTTATAMLDVLGTSKFTGNQTLIGTLTMTGDKTMTGTSTLTGNSYISGNVGIGTTSPTTKFELVGNSKFTGDITSIGAITATETLNAATGNEVAYTLNYTVNKATSGNDTGLLINQTDTASPGTSLLIDAQVGSASKFSVDNTGRITALSAIFNGKLDLSAIGAPTLQGSNSNASSIVFNQALSNNSTSPTFLLKTDAARSLNASTGAQVFTSLTPIYNQTGTAGGTDLLINRTETAVGSGTQLLIDAQVGGVSQFNVSNGGNVTLANTTGHLLLPQNNDATTPTLAFGDGDTGFYESVDDNLIIAIGGTAGFQFPSSANFQGITDGSASLRNGASGATVTTYTFRGDADTGIGSAAADQLSLIAGGVEGMRITEDTTIDVKVNGTLTANNNTWMRSLDSAGTGYVNMFKVNASDEIELGAALTNLGTYTFEADSGAVTAINMPVSATPTAGTEQSLSFSLDSTPILTVYAEADGAGSIQNQRVITIGNSLLSGTDRYLNFNTTVGTTGYGFRDNSGTMEYKNSGGSWTSFAAGGSSASGVFATSTDNILAYMKNGDDSNPFKMLIGGSATTTDVYVELTASSTDGYLAVSGSSNPGGIFMIDSNGNIGINDSTPSYKLDVNGTFQATGNSLIGGTLGVTGATTLTGNVTAYGTLTGANLVATSSIDIPSGATSDIDAEGELYIDTSSDTFRYYGAAERSLSYKFDKSLSVASSTYDIGFNQFKTATTTWTVWNPQRAVELTNLYCKTDTGTVRLRCGDGTNWTEDIVCSSTGQADDGSITNGTFTAREDFKCEIGTSATNPNGVTITATFLNTLD
jgi:hypothetical protein